MLVIGISINTWKYLLMLVFLRASQKELEFPQIDVCDAQFTETMS